MRICIVGLGAIGGHLAARLWKGGAHVSAVARGPQLAAVRASGLRITAPAETILAPIEVSDDPASLGPQDAVVVAVKAPALPAIATTLAPLLTPGTPVLFAMNGIPWWYPHGQAAPIDEATLAMLDPGGAMHRTVGLDRALGAVVYSACTVTEPGHIHVEHARNRLVIGEPAGPVSPRLSALAEVFRAGGLMIDETDAIHDALWSKLLLNLGSGMLGVLSGSPPRDFFQEPACEDGTRRIIAEGAAIAAALGRIVRPDPEGQIRNGRLSGHKTSILQDLELGRPMEIDALYSVPLRLARSAGVATPTLDLLAALIRTRARAAGLYAGPGA